MAQKFTPTDETRRLCDLASRYMTADEHSRFQKLALAGATVAQVDAVAKAKAATGTAAGGGVFEAAVAEYLTRHPGVKRSAAMTACRKANPEGYETWLQSQQR